MATRLPDGSIRLADGRNVFANSLIQAQDLIEILELMIPGYIPAPLWPFISGGGGGGSVSGTGVIGADGADGADGVQGNQGNQGPGVGAPGPQGAQGNQGNQGAGGAGVQGPQGNQGNQGIGGIQGNQGIQGSQGALNPDIYAATRVVSLIAGDGTDLTIAAAVAALPARGGKIFIKQGVYPITAPIVIPLGKSIIFEGAGADINTLGATAQASTVLDMSAGAAGIALFTQDCPGALIRSACYFRDFSVLGDNVSAQKFIQLTGIDAGMRIECVDVDIYRVRDIINTVEDTDAYFSFCKLQLALLANSSFFRNSGPGGELVWYEVDAVVGTATTDAIIAGAFPDPDWHVTDSYLGGGGGSTYAVNVIRWQTFNIDAAIVNVAGTTSRIDQCHTADVGITFASGICSIGDSLFFNGGPLGYVLSFGGANNAVSNCVFNGGTTRAIDVLAAAVDTVITGNSFIAYGTEEVRTASTGTVVMGNGNARVTETGAANANRFADIVETSTIIGTTTIVTDWNTRAIATTPVTLDITHRTVLSDATGGARVVNLPTAASARYRVYTIKKMDATVNTVTIDASGAETIDGATTQVLTAQYQSVTIQSNGTAWAII